MHIRFLREIWYLIWETSIQLNPWATYVLSKYASGLDPPSTLHYTLNTHEKGSICVPLFKATSEVVEIAGHQEESPACHEVG